VRVVDLDLDEQLALCALLGHLVTADGVVTLMEKGEIDALGRALGLERFRRTVHGARKSFADREALLSYTRGVIDRPRSRTLVLQILADCALSDGLDAREAEFIRAVAALWDLESPL
jgi:uncharacterized tellurite resistance protein B-like protein